MTISISRNYFWEIFFEDEPSMRRYDPADEFDILWQYPSQFGEGYCREIELQEGLGLLISDYQLHDRLIVKVPERNGDLVQCEFHLVGGSEYWEVSTGNDGTYGAGQYGLDGGGTRPKAVGAELAEQRQQMVNLWMSPERFRSFAGNRLGELEPLLQHLIDQSTQGHCYHRSGVTSPAMQTVLLQLLRCPYQGTTKRIYLEGKALELMALLIQQEQEVQQGRPINISLKPNDIDRLHHARTLLLQQIKQPPSLTELVRQVGLNECTLKRGFRQIFGTTAFSYLHDYRMEQAQQLLETGIYKVEEVAQIVGYRNLSAFSKAFLKQYGIRARDCKKKGSSKI